MAPSRCLFYKTRVLSVWGKVLFLHIARLMISLAKGSKRKMTKVQQPCWRTMSCMVEWCNPLFSVSHVTRKATDLLCAVHQVHDNWFASLRTWSRRSCRQSFGRAQTCRNQRVKFTKAVVRHADIRDQIPSLGYICPREPHERSPNAPKSEDRSLEETEWQEQGAREAAWKLAKSVLKSKDIKEQHFSHFRKIGACPTPERRCIWSAKRTWVMLKWILWRNRALLR